MNTLCRLYENDIMIWSTLVRYSAQYKIFIAAEEKRSISQFQVTGEILIFQSLRQYYLRFVWFIARWYTSRPRDDWSPTLIVRTHLRPRSVILMTCIIFKVTCHLLFLIVHFIIFNMKEKRNAFYIFYISRINLPSE